MKGTYRNWVLLGVCTAVVVALLSALNLMYGNLNQDEGWYLYAARMVRDGSAPYVDYAYTQGPVLPFIYRFFYPVVDSLGVAGGRLVTMGFGLIAGLLAAATAARMTERNRVFAALAAWVLVGCCVYQSYFTTVVKTYGLCACLLMCGFFMLTYRKGYGALLAGIFMALAAGTRLSAGIVLPITGLWLIFQRERRREWLWFGIGGGLTLLAVFLPFFVSAYEQTCFGLFGYHAGRDPGGLKALVILKLGFVSRFVQAYFVFVILTAAALCWKPKERRHNPWGMLLWASGIGLSLIHVIAAFPYDDYQTIAYPVFAAALVVTLAPRVEERWQCPALSFLLLVMVASAFSSPINQDWFVRGRDRIWWRFKEKSDLVLLREAADVVRMNSPAESMLLTQDTYLAVESGRRVPPGMEMGPFCYYPDLSRDDAEKLHLLNKEMLLEILVASDAPLAAFSGYGLAIESPSIDPVSDNEQSELMAAVLQRYGLVLEIPNFGQAHTVLKLYGVRNETR